MSHVVIIHDADDSVTMLASTSFLLKRFGEMTEDGHEKCEVRYGKNSTANPYNWVAGYIKTSGVYFIRIHLSQLTERAIRHDILF
jgi:hypothetical protein